LRSESDRQLSEDLKDSLTLAHLGWGHNEVSYYFAKWLVTHQITKDNMEAFVRMAIDGDLDYEAIEWNDDDDCLDLFYTTDLKNDEMTKVWFDGFRFENYVGPKDLAYDCHMRGPGQTITVSARDWIKEHWKEEAYDFITNSWKYAEIEEEI